MAKASFGEWVKRRRKALGLTQEQLARQLSFSTSALRKIEAEERRPSEQMVERLAELFSIPSNEQIAFLHFARGNWRFAPAEVVIDAPWRESIASPRSNLPAPLTSFIGREKEQAEILRLVSKYRLVTLVGSGGVGKTRLSLKIGEQVLEDYVNGVWSVELAPILDPLLVPRIIAIAIGLHDEPQRPVIDMLSDYLREKKMLLIIDNCEHLLDACARLADMLLKNCPNLKILATSREALGILGEAVYHVPSLALPDMQQLLEKFRDYESVRLFEERAQLAQIDFSLTLENASSIAKICNRLNGIPLAIELAAARVGTFSTEQIAARLQESFHLLTTGNRTALPRHQTLQAAIDWSYDLLSTAEQTLFQRLSVFVNGWTLEAAESICSDAKIKSEDVLDLLAQLIKKSLVNIEELQSDTRYSMLETMRQYANEKLVESSESDALRDSHLEYFLNLAETTEPHLTRPEQLEWLPLLDADYVNLRLALGWALSKEPAVLSLRLCAALGMFWVIRGHWMEGSRWLASALAKPAQEQDGAEKVARVRALCQDAALAELLDNLERMKASSELGLKLAQEDSDQRDIAIARFYVGFALFRLEDFSKVRPYLEQSLTEFQKLNDPYWEANAYMWLVALQFNQGEPKLIEHAVRSLELARKAGERFHLAWDLIEFSYLFYRYGRTDEARKHLEEAETLSKQISSNTNSITFVFAQFNLARIEWVAGNHQQARVLLIESQARLRLLGERQLSSSCSELLGLLSMEEGDFNQAQVYLEEALLTTQELETNFFLAKRLVLSILFYLQGDIKKSRQYLRESISLTKDLSPYRKAYFLESLFISPYFQMPENSVRLLGAICRLQKKNDIPMEPLFKRYCIQAEARARETLGEAAFESEFAVGQKMSLDEALDFALITVEEM